MSLKTRDDISIRTILEDQASFIEEGEVKYYFLPFYFKDEGSDEFEMLRLDILPENLKKLSNDYEIIPKIL